MSAGMKFDGGKWRLSLLPIKPLIEIVGVLEFGAKKYAEDNWKVVENGRRRYFDACIRHLTSWFLGEKKDPESGFSHLAHAGCCLFFLMQLDEESNYGDENKETDVESEEKLESGE